MRKVYTIGDCVLDVIFENNKPVDAKPGGSFLNSSVTIGRLGVAVSLISELGKDRVGDQIKEFLEDNNVNTQHITSFSDTNSNLALAFLDESKNADYSFYKTRKGLKSCVVFPESVNKNDIVLFGSFLAIKEEFREPLVAFLKKCKEQGAILIYDPNFRSQHLPLLPDVLPYIKENMKLADIVKGSDEDFKLICNAENDDRAFTWLKKFSNAMLIYTANKNGLSIYTESKHQFQVPQIVPISTVGAGDTVNAAIAYFLVRNEINQINELSDADIKDMVSYAIKFSQEVCMVYDNFLPAELAKEYSL